MSAKHGNVWILVVKKFQVEKSRPKQGGVKPEGHHELKNTQNIKMYQLFIQKKFTPHEPLETGM